MTLKTTFPFDRTQSWPRPIPNSPARPCASSLPATTLNEHGITFERQANGDGVFTVNFMVDGQRIHRVIGRESDGTTRTQAEEFIDKARQDAKAGRLNLPKGRKLALTFSEAARQIP
jgi:hypothetical protein